MSLKTSYLVFISLTMKIYRRNSGNIMEVHAYHGYRSISDQTHKIPKLFRTRNTMVSTVCNDRKTMQRFLTALQFFRSAGYVGFTVDHGIMTTILHGFKIGSTRWGSRNFPSENAAAANPAGFDCVFAFGKSHNLVARGGIEPPTRGFSD